MKPIKITGLEDVQVQWYEEKNINEETKERNESNESVEQESEEVWMEEDDQDASWKRQR